MLRFAPRCLASFCCAVLCFVVCLLVCFISLCFESSRRAVSCAVSCCCCIVSRSPRVASALLRVRFEMLCLSCAAVFCFALHCVLPSALFCLALVCLSCLCCFDCLALFRIDLLCFVVFVFASLSIALDCFVSLCSSVRCFTLFWEPSQARLLRELGPANLKPSHRAYCKVRAFLGKPNCGRGRR